MKKIFLLITTIFSLTADQTAPERSVSFEIAQLESQKVAASLNAIFSAIFVAGGSCFILSCFSTNWNTLNEWDNDRTKAYDALFTMAAINAVAVLGFHETKKALVSLETNLAAIKNCNQKIQELEKKQKDLEVSAHISPLGINLRLEL